MTEDEQTEKKGWFRGRLTLTITVLKGFAIPVSLGLLGYLFSWPLGYLNCTYYGEATEHPTKYVFWSCYVQDKQGEWLTKQEFQSSKLGVKLVLSPQL